jgi:hypothetical protein
MAADFRSNGEVEKALRESLRKQGLDFCPDGIFNLVPRWDRCFPVLRDYVEKYLYFTGIGKLRLR